MDNNNLKKAYFKGTFYPNTSQEIDDMIDFFNSILDKNLEDKSLLDIKSRCLIVPHAGYIYSGFTANLAFRTLKNNNIKRIIVIGPTHKIDFNSISIGLYDNYETPYGDLKIDKSYGKKLKSTFNLEFLEKVHQEHSTEVQIPFIKKYYDNIEVLELIYGNYHPTQLAPLIEYLLNDKDNLVLISTDLSHFHNLEKANKIDNICLKAIENSDINLLYNGCEACGRIGIEAILLVAKKIGLKSKILDYRTSADSTKDKDSVVGYMSASFY